MLHQGRSNAIIEEFPQPIHPSAAGAATFFGFQFSVSRAKSLPKAHRFESLDCSSIAVLKHAALSNSSPFLDAKILSQYFLKIANRRFLVLGFLETKVLLQEHPPCSFGSQSNLPLTQNKLSPPNAEGNLNSPSKLQMMRQRFGVSTDGGSYVHKMMS